MEQDRLTISKQGELLGLSRSTYYYESCRDETYRLYLMHGIDEEYIRHPFLGYRSMTQWLKEQGDWVNRKRVAGLMKVMGIQGIFRQRQTSGGDPEHKRYPYLLRVLDIQRPNQVWSVDITYIRMMRGFLFLVAIMD